MHPPPSAHSDEEFASTKSSLPSSCPSAPSRFQAGRVGASALRLLRLFLSFFTKIFCVPVSLFSKENKKTTRWGNTLHIVITETQTTASISHLLELSAGGDRKVKCWLSRYCPNEAPLPSVGTIESDELSNQSEGMLIDGEGSSQKSEESEPDEMTRRKLSDKKVSLYKVRQPSQESGIGSGETENNKRASRGTDDPQA